MFLCFNNIRIQGKSPVAYAVLRSKAMVVLLLIHCLLMLISLLGILCLVLFFVVQY